MSYRFYRPNAEKVAAEIIDDEAIIINVATGNYYNTEGVGGWVWEQCAAGMGLDEIIARATEKFGVDASLVRGDFEQFLACLEEEELVTGSDTGSIPDPLATEPDAVKATYAAPKLMAYRDLKDLLALDPPMPRLGAEKHAATAQQPR